MNINDYKSKAEKIRSTDVYNVYDLKQPFLTLSLTELHPMQNTKGHSHEADEIYIVISGIGQIQIGDAVNQCVAGDVFTIPRGSFHKVYNFGTSDLKFWCVFENYGR